MKKLSIFLICLFAFTAISNAQNCNYYVDTTTKNINCGVGVQLSSSFNKNTITSMPNTSLYSVYFTDVNTGYAVGNSGKIVKTTNAGNAWTALTSGTAQVLWSVYFTDASTGYAVGNSGTIIKTTNAGSTWTALTSGVNISLYSIYFTDANTGYAVGNSGTIIKTTNAGSTWFALTSGTTNPLNSVYFTDANTGYAVGNYGTIVKTNNAGSSWNPLTSGTNNLLYSVYFINANIGYAVGDSGTIVKTTNAGSSWTALTSGTNNFLSSIYFTDANTGYVVGGIILKTTNAGSTWTAITIGTSQGLGLIYFTNTNTGYAFGGSQILKITDIDNASYSWLPTTGLDYPNSPTPKAKPNTTTTYKVTITPNSSTNCGIHTDSVKVVVAPMTVNAGIDVTKICGDSVMFNPTTTYAGNPSNLSWLWSPAVGLSSTIIQSPKANPGITTKYIVNVNSIEGCTAKDTIQVSLTPMNPQEICMVSIRNNKNMVMWDKPISTAIDSFYVWRETNVTGIYDNIGAVAYSDSSIFVDNTSNPTIQSNKYKLSIKDVCNLESNKSTIAHKTMHLSINQGTGTSWNLIWEAYEGFTVNTYNIFRGTTPNNLSLIGTTSGSSTQYTDFTAPSGYVYYQLQVVSPNACNPSKSYNMSLSNIATNASSGLSENTTNNTINVYPNPVSNELIIEIKGNKDKLNFEILNAIGQVVFNGKLIEKTIIETTNFTPGVYLIKLENRKSYEFKKIVKE
ncbi:MAG: YCF48-related protein [Bacteroidales bacterium]